MKMIFSLVWTCCLSLGCTTGWAAVEVYQYPKEAPQAADFMVAANGQPVFVYDTKVAAMACFGLAGKAEIRVKPGSAFKQVVIRPLSRGIKPTVTNGMIAFTIDSPVQLSLELDGNISRPLFLFANSPETRPAKLDDPNLIYFAPGRIHQAGLIKLKSNQTLYLAGGAVVQGYVRAENADNIKIIGPGILDNSYEQTKTHNMILVGRCRNVEIRDLLILDAWGWTVRLRQSTDLLVDNMKEVGWRANSDGIDVDASRSVMVTHCFQRTGDDKVAIKIMYDEKGYRTVEDVTFADCVFYGPCRDLEIGFELNGEAIRNITFRNCDIVHSMTSDCFSIHNGGKAVVENIHFENIRVEDARSVFVELRLGLSWYSQDFPKEWRDVKILPNGQAQRTTTGDLLPDGILDRSSGGSWFRWFSPPNPSAYATNRGSIRNVSFKSIQVVESKSLPIIVIGYDDQHCIENVTFQGITVNGQPVTKWPDDKLKLGHATHVRFEE